MGGFNQGFDDVVQEVPNAILGRGAYDSPAFFDAGTRNNRWIYYAGQGDSLRAFQLFDNGTLSTSSTSQSSHIFGSAHGAEPSLSANGTTNAIVWAIDPVPAGAVLYAYDATNVANELYDSSQAGTRDQLDGGVKFTAPTIADGQVYVGTTDTLSVFGLLPGGPPAPARTGPTASGIDPGIVFLIGSLTSQNSPGISGGVPLFKAEQGNFMASRPLPQTQAGQTSAAASSLALLMGSTDRFARDIVFATRDSPARHLASGGQFSTHDLDPLAVDSPGSSAGIAS
jgi:hypothetical protein